MTTPLDTSAYKRVIALDSQMLFEARPLADLDWQSLGDGPILLLILPQVSAEVDARKRDGRLGKRARDLNRLIEPSIETGMPVPLVAGAVRVDIGYAAAGPADWSRLDDLESDNGDDRIVAQMLHARIDRPERIEILSFDSRPRAGARRHGAGAIKPAETWLLDPEPSPADRRVAELEQRVRLLQSQEPALRLALRPVGDPPAIRVEVDALPEQLHTPIAKMILARNPKARMHDPFAINIRANPDYDREYTAYARAVVESDVPNLHRGVARLFSQHLLELRVENSGVMAAEHVTLEFRSGNAQLYADPFYVQIFGRDAPEAERDFPIFRQDPSGPPADRAQFYLGKPEAGDAAFDYRCQDFRHGRVQTILFVIELTEKSGEAAQVEIRATAGNMRGDVVVREILPVVVETRQLGELIDLDKLDFREAPPVAKRIAELYAEDDDDMVRYRNDGTRSDEL